MGFTLKCGKCGFANNIGNIIDGRIMKEKHCYKCGVKIIEKINQNTFKVCDTLISK